MAELDLTGQVVASSRRPAIPPVGPLDRGTAPLFTCEGSCAAHRVEAGSAVVLMGRIDAVDELRRALGQAGGGDLPGMLLAGYRRWGPYDFAARLCGDFAIVLWDGAAGRLVLTRSPSGMRALCYEQHGPDLCFATNARAIVQGRSDCLDERALAEWLALRPCLSDRTPFAGIHRVPPGSSVIFERGRLEIHRHWRPETLGTLRLRTHQDYADALRETLRVAVADRLRDARGDVAAQLSGGLDSSSVTALAAEHLAPSARKVFAFTAVPGSIGRSPVGGRFFDEGDHASAVAARHENVRHARVTPASTPLFEVLDRHTDIEAGPPFNPHHLRWIDRTYEAAAATGATTLLTGSMGNMTISRSGDFAIGDALQGGRLAQAAKLFAAERRAGTRALRHLPGIVAGAFLPRLLDVADRWHRRRTELEEFTGLRSGFARANGIEPSRWNRRLPFRTAREQALDSVDRFDFGMFHETPRRLHGIDATDPTFDRRVIELSLQIPLDQFCMGGVPRALIRTAMAEHLPDVVRLERRRGLQSADFLTTLRHERAAIGQELTRMAQIDLLQRAIDIPLLQERLTWSEESVIAYGWHQYSARLMRAVSMGRFVRRALDGTLFGSIGHDAGAPPNRVAISL